MLRTLGLVGIVGALIVVALLIGCAEKGVTDVSGIAAISNPYEWVGEAHNEGLAFGMRELGAQSKVEIADISRVVDRFMQERRTKYPIGDFPAVELDWAEIINPAVGGADCFLAYLTDLEKGGRISHLYRDRAGEIIRLIELEDFHALRDLERSILESGMNATEQVGLLSGIAVARHSNDFWHEGVESGAVKINDMRPVVIADLCGALGGAIAGGIISGGVGAAAGGLGGAIGASTCQYLLG